MFSRIKSWFSKDSGATAVEFSLLALPFITLLVGIVETSLFFASGVVLEGAANDAARMVRTGQAQLAADPVQAFEDKLCDKVSLLISCGDIKYEVRAIPSNSFANAASLTPTFDANGDLVSGGFTPGGANDAILVRVVYRYQFLTPFLGAMLSSGAPSSKVTLMSTIIVKNEPYEFGG